MTLPHLSWHNLHLMRVMGFDEQDLDANRQGTVSDVQRNRYAHLFSLSHHEAKEVAPLVQAITGPLYKDQARTISLIRIYDNHGKFTNFSISFRSYPLFIKDDIYTLYYEPRTLTLLSVEHLSLPEDDEYPDTLLRTGLKFSAEERELNRDTRLSHTQTRRVKRYYLFSAIRLEVYGLLLALVGTFDFLNWWNFPVFCIFLAIWSALILARYALSIKTLASQPIVSCTGIIEKIEGGWITLRYTENSSVETKNFYIRSGGEIFIPFERYILYYLPHNLLIHNPDPVLSAEHIPDIE